MQIFLDTANIDEIKQATKLGIISGATTNPSMVSKEATIEYEAISKEICSIINGPVSVEVLVGGVEPMIEQARQISTWAPNVVVKIPATADGLEVTSVLARENIKVNFTLCFSLNQSLLGALAGATYVSPFVGRLDDAGHDGMQVVKDIVDVFKHYELSAQVIAASIRHPQHCVATAKAGAHIIAIPYNVLMQMIRHPLLILASPAFFLIGGVFHNESLIRTRDKSLQIRTKISLPTTNSPAYIRKTRRALPIPLEHRRDYATLETEAIIQAVKAKLAPHWKCFVS